MTDSDPTSRGCSNSILCGCFGVRSLGTMLEKHLILPDREITFTGNSGFIAPDAGTGIWKGRMWYISSVLIPKERWNVLKKRTLVSCNVVGVWPWAQKRPSVHSVFTNGKVYVPFRITSRLGRLLLPWPDRAAGRHGIYKASPQSPQSLTSRLSFLTVLIIQRHS